MHLDVKAAMSAVLKKIKPKLSTFYIIRRYLDTETSIIILKTMLAPIFDYCSFLFECKNANLLMKLQAQLNRAMRIALRLDRMTSVRDRFGEYNMLNLSSRRKIQLIMNVVRIFCEEGYNISDRSTRGTTKELVYLPRPRCESYRKSPYYLGCKLFNELPVELRKNYKLSGFKIKLKKYLLELQHIIM